MRSPVPSSAGATTVTQSYRAERRTVDTMGDLKMTSGALTPEQVDKVTAALDACAKAIDEA